MVWRRPIGHAGGNGGHLAPTGIDRRQPQRSFELMTAVFLLVLIAACNGTPPAPTVPTVGSGCPARTRAARLGCAIYPFEERAELAGQGPAVFCDADYAYLSEDVLAGAPGPASAVVRPPCE